MHSDTINIEVDLMHNDFNIAYWFLVLFIIGLFGSIVAVVTAPNYFCDGKIVWNRWATSNLQKADIVYR